jgi:hypothetical protein
MSKLPIVGARKMEQVLLHLGFAAVRQTAATSSTAILMVAPRRCRITPGAIWDAP